jgi:hypothetical protein
VKKLKKSRAENEACVLALAWVIAWGVGCYERSMDIIIVASLFVGVLLACSWRIERLEKRIAYYRRELGRQIRAELEAEEEEHEPHITISKGA